MGAYSLRPCGPRLPGRSSVCRSPEAIPASSEFIIVLPSDIKRPGHDLVAGLGIFLRAFFRSPLARFHITGGAGHKMFYVIRSPEGLPASYEFIIALPSDIKRPGVRPGCGAWDFFGGLLSLPPWHAFIIQDGPDIKRPHCPKAKKMPPTVMVGGLCSLVSIPHRKVRGVNHAQKVGKPLCFNSS